MAFLAFYGLTSGMIVVTWGPRKEMFKSKISMVNGLNPGVSVYSQVFETSVTNSSLSKDYLHPDDHAKHIKQIRLACQHGVAECSETVGQYGQRFSSGRYQ